jgi:hypothetical protein
MKGISILFRNTNFFFDNRPLQNLRSSVQNSSLVLHLFSKMGTSFDSSSFTLSGSDTSAVYTGDSSSCTLSPHDKFLSTVLTAFIGSIVTGISGGFFIAFCTAWICWFATMRILVVGILFCKSAIMGQKLEGGFAWLRKVPLVNRAKGVRGGTHPFFKSTETGYTPIAPPSYDDSIRLEQQAGVQSQSIDTMTPPDESITGSKTKSSNPQAKLFGAVQSSPPTFLGWAGWMYATLYFPVVQVLWLIGNWSNGPSSGNIKLVRAIGVAVTALPLTMDNKARYAVALEKKFGKWTSRIFTAIHAFSTLSLGIVSLVMLVVATIQMPIPIFFVPIYLIFSTIWMLGSFLIFPPFDGGMSPNSIATFAAGLAMGIFGGAFTSAPAFGSMNMAATSPGVSLGEYFQCESVDVWRKFIAIFP